MKKTFNRHYIVIRSDKVVIDTWSDGPEPNKDISEAICINDKGGYQFRFKDGEEENPSIFNFDGIPLYKWDGKQVVNRTEKEIELDRKEIPLPPPSPIDQLRADVDFLFVMGGLS